MVDGIAAGEVNIRSEIIRLMEARGYNLSRFSLLTGINRGTLSGILNKYPPTSIAIRHLDVIAKALGFEEGWMYEAYVQECYQDGTGNWRKTKPFLRRCIELNRQDLIHRVLSQVLEDLVRLQDIFELGEELYSEGKRKESILFYQCVAENEIRQHSERLAISHYKWFRAELGVDAEKNREAAQRFAPFRNRLPDHYQLDGLLQLANIYFILKKWDDVKTIAEEMHDKVLTCLSQHNKRSRRRPQQQEHIATERHFVVYYGQSFLLRGNALEKQGDYQQALTYIPHYEDLSGFNGLDEEGLIEVDKLKMYAEANRVNLRVLMGDFDFLPPYVAFLDNHPAELLSGLITILESANNYQYDIDHVLMHFNGSIQLLQHDLLDHSFYPRSFTFDRHSNVFQKLALYSLHRGRTKEGIDYLLQALKSAVQANNKKIIVDCAARFEQFRQHGTAHQKTEYKSIMKGVIDDAQMDDVAATRSDS